jgi:hypothetical protein
MTELEQHNLLAGAMPFCPDSAVGGAKSPEWEFILFETIQNRSVNMP